MEELQSFVFEEDKLNTQFYVELAGITYPDPHYQIERKNSPIFCLEYIIEGEGIIYVDNKEYYPRKGDIYILPAEHNQLYYSSPTNPWKKIWMNVYGPLCDILIPFYHLEDTVLIHQLDLYPLFLKFLQICRQKDTPTQEIFLQASCTFHEILSRISSHLYSLPQTHHPVAFKIKNYIDKNINDKFTLTELAKIACLSPSQLNRVFKKEYGATPYEYILTQKIETAKTLLKNTNISVKETAYRLNFADEHYFSNIFKKKCGKPPREYVRAK
jgi:AraC-like DNA-binding protein